MRKQITGTDGRYLLFLVAFCAGVPHLVLGLLQMDCVSAFLSPFEVEGYANFFVCQWIPFWLTFLSCLRLQKTDRTSLIPAMCAAVIVLTYLPRFAQRSLGAIALTIPLMLLIELSGLLKKAEFSGNKALAGIAADRGTLRAFCYWSVVFLCVVHISCKACTYSTTVVSPLQMFLFPGVLRFDVFRHEKKQPPAIWCIAAMLAVIPPSLYLATIGSMAKFKVYHLVCLGIGFALLFMMLILYNIDHWKKQI